MLESFGRARPAACWHLLERTRTTKLGYSGVLNWGHASIRVARYSRNVIIWTRGTLSVTSQVFMLLLKPLCYSSSLPVTLQASLFFFRPSCFFTHIPVISQAFLLLHRSSCYFSSPPVTPQAFLLLYRHACSPSGLPVTSHTHSC
jgi:hypothetical protein